MGVFYRGGGWCVSPTLCRYEIRMGLLLVLSWARLRRVSLGRESSEGDILGACVCTMLLCICVEFVVICCCVTVFLVGVYVVGVVDVVECGLFLESRYVWVDCQFV